MPSTLETLPLQTGHARSAEWDLWLDRQVWSFTHGEDYTCSTADFRSRAHVAAKARGLLVKTVATTTGLAIQARLPREEALRKLRVAHAHEDYMALRGGSAGALSVVDHASVRAFLMTETAAGGSTPFAAVLAAYQAWAERSGVEALRPRRFGYALEAMGAPPRRGTGGVATRALHLTPLEVPTLLDPPPPPTPPRERPVDPGYAAYATRQAERKAAEDAAYAAEVHQAALGFLAERTTPGGSTPLGALYAAYQGWSAAAGAPALSVRDFGAALDAAGCSAVEAPPLRPVTLRADG